jgi:hypothetical protein
MKFITQWVVLLGFFYGISAGPAFAGPAWWHVCASCQTQNEFRIAAIAAGDDETTVFISDPESLVTKKFDRFTTWEDFGAGMVRMTHVTELDMTQQEQDEFRSALEAAKVVFATIDAEWVNNFAGIPPHDSALLAIRNGYLGNSFFYGLQTTIRYQGLIPSRESVATRLGFNIRGLSGNVGVNGSLRVDPLALRVQYPDGSHINAIYNPDGSWSDVSVVDIEGNVLDINVDASLNPIVAATVVGDYVFSGEDIRDAVTDFVQSVNRSVRPDRACTWRERPNGVMHVDCPSG